MVSNVSAATAQQQVYKSQAASRTQTVQFSAKPDSFDKNEQEPQEDKVGWGAPFSTAMKWGGLTALAGLGLLAAAPFSAALSAIPGVILLGASPFVGVAGFVYGTFKLGKSFF